MTRTKEQMREYMREYRKRNVTPVTPAVIPQAVPLELKDNIPLIQPDRLVERKLCLHQEFLNRTFFPIHKYNSRHLMVDIRDHYSPSLDKACSYLSI